MFEYGFVGTDCERVERARARCMLYLYGASWGDFIYSFIYIYYMGWG